MQITSFNTYIQYNKPTINIKKENSYQPKYLADNVPFGSSIYGAGKSAFFSLLKQKITNLRKKEIIELQTGFVEWFLSKVSKPTKKAITVLERKTKKPVQAELIYYKYECRDEPKANVIKNFMNLYTIRVNGRKAGTILIEQNEYEKVNSTYIKLLECCNGRKKYKNLANILLKAVFEHSFQGAKPAVIGGESMRSSIFISFSPSILYSHYGAEKIAETSEFLPSRANMEMSKKAIRAKIEKMVREGDYLFEDTPHRLRELIEKQKWNMPDTLAILKKQTER